MMGVGKLAQEFKHHGRAGQAGEIALVKGRRDFHHVGTNQIQSSKLTNAALRLQRGHTANFRRSGTWRIDRIQDIDIEADIGRLLADNRAASPKALAAEPNSCCAI